MNIKALVLPFALLTGCQAFTLHQPSDAMVALIEDLKSKGYSCSTGMSEIECVQQTSFTSKTSSVCTAEEGCIARPDRKLVNVYFIRENDKGTPIIRQAIRDQ